MSSTPSSRGCRHLGVAGLVLPCLLLMVAVGAAPAQACYTGLVSIPTAEVLGSGQYGLELQFDGAFALQNPDTRLLNTELGFSPRLEAGVDFDLSQEADTRALLNAKYLLAIGGRAQPALAVGLCNAGPDSSSTPYLVATQEFPGLRAHLGLARTEDNGCWFAGVDHALDDRLTLTADYTSGEDNSATVGASYRFTDTFGAMAGLVFPNASGDDTRFTIHFVLNGPYLRAAQEH